MKNRIGIDPSGTGTTAIAIYDDKGELKLESYKNDDGLKHGYYLEQLLWGKGDHTDYYEMNCEFTTHIRVLTKDTISLLNLEGVIKNEFDVVAVNSSHTKRIAKLIKANADNKEVGTYFMNRKDKITKKTIKVEVKVKDKEKQHILTLGIKYESKKCNKCLTPKDKKPKVCTWWLNDRCLLDHERDAIIIANGERKK